MKLLLKSIRDRLMGDATLTASVPAIDITTSYTAETANYPAIEIGISEGGSGLEIPNATRAELRVEVFSKLNKQELWEIYALIKGLLHNQELNISTTDRKIHIIYEDSVDADLFDAQNNVWRLISKYTILYSTSSVIGTTNVNGRIYADLTDVTAVSGKEIAKVRGELNFDISYESVLGMEQERFAKTIYCKNGTARLTLGEVIFRATIFNKVWGISSSADTLADDSTVATSYTVTQSTIPPYLQLLFQLTKTDDGKKLEIEADRAVCESMQIPFSKRDFAIHDCKWLFLGDDSGNVVKVSIED